MEEELSYFYSIGKTLAEKLITILLKKELVTKEYIKKEHSIKELKALLKKPEIYEILPEATKTDLTYNPLRTIPRKIIEMIDKEFHHLIKNMHFEIGGSYIRGKITSSDIDMVLEFDTKNENEKNESTWPKFYKEINDNSKFLEIMPAFASGPDKVGTLIKVKLEPEEIKQIRKDYPQVNPDDIQPETYVKIDVFLSTKEDFVYAMLFAIGSGVFNVQMRAVAKKRGYLLNNYGLFKINGKKMEKLPLKTERDIFEALGMRYREPYQRVPGYKMPKKSTNKLIKNTTKSTENTTKSSIKNTIKGNGKKSTKIHKKSTKTHKRITEKWIIPKKK